MRPEELLPFASSPVQKKTIQAVIEHGSMRAAGRALEVDEKTVRRCLQRVERSAAQAQPALHANQAPAGYALRGVSTLLGADGAVKQQWLKTARLQDDPKVILEAFQAALEASPLPAKGRIKLASKDLDADRFVVYPMGDPHLGMMAWHLETGEDFDLKIAEQHLVGAVDHLVELAPDAEQALIINVGDFFHADTLGATTTAGTRVDVDSRWSRVLQIGINTMVRCIDRALEKHKSVHVINEIGNHDTHTAMMLSVCLAHHYRDNPRVAIDTSPAKFHKFEFGRALICTTHGDTCKPKDLPGVMLADWPEAVGRTKFRHWYTGHVHHKSVDEFAGCTVETLRTLAAKDAWHAGQGYRSGRSMVCDVWDRDRGRVLRHEVGVESLK